MHRLAMRPASRPHRGHSRPKATVVRVRPLPGRPGGTAATALVLIALALGAGSLTATAAPTAAPAKAAAAAAANAACAHPASSGAELAQAPNGTVSGCWLVGVHPTGHDTVALSGYRGAFLGGATVGRAVAVTLSPSGGRPGTTVTILGRLLVPIPTRTAPAMANVCFDGCDGLVDQATPVHWHPGAGVPAGTVARFTALGHVPTAPFYVGDRVQGLVSGTYPVGIACLGPAISGCGLHPAEGSAPFHLTVTHPVACRPVMTCTTLHLSPASGPPGTAVAVHGFAPVMLEIGNEPFAYSLSVRPAPTGAAPAGPPTGGGSLTLAPAPFTVTAPRPWSSLAATRPVRSVATGPSPGPISQDAADPSLLAHCAPGGVGLVSSATGAVVRTIPTSAVAGAELPGHLRLWPGVGGGPATGRPAPTCVDVLVALPRSTTARGNAPDVVLAAFTAASPVGAPPIDNVAMATTDGGRTWHALPIPRGAGPGTFSAFAVAPDHRLVARFATSQDGRGGGAGRRPAEVEEISTDGVHWRTATVGCPPVGPCLRLGPFAPGNCAMNGAFQFLLTARGAPGRLSPLTGQWPGPVNACRPGQLAATSVDGALVIDSTSPFLVEATADGGRHFVDVGLPPLDVANGTPPLGDGGSFPPGSGGLVLLPDGSLLETTGALPAIAGHTAARPAPWHLLRPGATAWCAVGPLIVHGPGAVAGEPISTPVPLGGRLWWQAQAPPSGASSGALASAAGPVCRAG